ncbi:hypothetical protein MiSe_90410 [Microseira wollei NIES-4236]|uniref:Uncharacterized protein n=1 Tax=Microseira wollei NIES-4236 TaxID=2530354 RepID=A0AAV3XTR1_9CYAN|nr:hypothetical protein MiSe_90410 [Microseira wollei NIES-4236]
MTGLMSNTEGKFTSNTKEDCRQIYDNKFLQDQNLYPFLLDHGVVYLTRDWQGDLNLIPQCLGHNNRELDLKIYPDLKNHSLHLG